MICIFTLSATIIHLIIPKDNLLTNYNLIYINNPSKEKSLAEALG